MNKKHEKYEKKNVKWRLASSKVNNLRYTLEDILSSFSEEEKQSERYKQFVQTISSQVDHLLGDYNKKNQESIENKNGWVSYKSAIIAAVAVVVAKMIEIIPSLISILISAFGGTP